ncbi:hypothetical protein FRB90_006920 [Tulasnella sp. 427]|nr:hypothetical protein FRB90_006920 [Tulasnella sp. 427]
MILRRIFWLPMKGAPNCAILAMPRSSGARRQDSRQDPILEERTRIAPPRYLTVQNGKNSPQQPTSLQLDRPFFMSILSGKQAWYYIQAKARLITAVSTATPPIRANYVMQGSDVALDALWDLLFKCWKLKPNERPSAQNVLDAVSPSAPTVEFDLSQGRPSFGPFN